MPLFLTKIGVEDGTDEVEVEDREDVVVELLRVLELVVISLVVVVEVDLVLVNDGVLVLCSLDVVVELLVEIDLLLVKDVVIDLVLVVGTGFRGVAIDEEVVDVLKLVDEALRDDEDGCTGDFLIAATILLLPPLRYKLPFLR